MKDFKFMKPTTLDEATAVLADYGDQAAVLAGGTDLIVAMRANVRRPAVVMDAKHIPQLMAIEYDEGFVSIGGAVSTGSGFC